MLTLVSRPATSLVSLRAELGHTREDPLRCAKPLQDYHRSGEAPLCLQNHSFSPGKDRLCPQNSHCMPYEVGEQWQGRVRWGLRWLF